MTGDLDPWQLNLHTNEVGREMGCGVGDPPNAKTIEKKEKDLMASQISCLQNIK